MQKNVTIIGGGPAGLKAAEDLAQAGFKVALYDVMPSLGRKLLMAGRGGLNLTHSEPLNRFISRYDAAAARLEPVLKAFPPDALQTWCKGLGQKTFVGSSGRVFPTSMKASPLLRAWLRRLNDLGVVFYLRHRWRGWNDKSDLLFTDAASGEITVRSDAVLLALGGASWPRLGSDGGWVNILRDQGIAVSPLRPANGGFIAPWSEKFAESFAGTPLKPVTATFGDMVLQGEIMVTRQGLEGGVIYALSAPLRDTIADKGEAILSLDLRPGLSLEKLAGKLQAPRGSQSLSTYLRKAAGLPSIAIGLLRETTQDLPTDTSALATRIKNVSVRLTATASLDRAISTAGGIAWDAVDDNFMLKAKPGVFVAGEMLDWEAPTGGYLLQGCFSTAVAAARGVQTWLTRQAKVIPG